ncbi:2-methylpropanoate--CoA ligase CCL4-like [Prosopis cineraria]|uniref:2-methylpropanoate--CoA ligase CCL4-like n=1 Tax=Prosopis cineraria TaxID=364024 RepID=UPI00240F4596|nr:2-methylpropanoate--CoA ligase CCL4-like [Prosopis cineraria]
MEHLKPNSANSPPLTPLGLLDRAATLYGDCTSIICNHITFTWSETHRRCLQLASSLSSLGIRRGDIVSVVAPNIPAVYELQFAVPFTGAVLNNINYFLHDAHALTVILRQAKPKLVFVDCASSSQVLKAISKLPPETPRPILVHITDDSVEPKSSDGFSHTYEGLVASGDPNFQWIRPNSEWDPMTLTYTMVAPGTSKGVVHCHRGIFTTTVNFLIEWAVPKKPVFLWSTLYKNDDICWSFPWGIAAVGGTNICVRRINSSDVYSLIKSHGVTHMCAEPETLNMIITNSQKTERLKMPVQVLTAGAAAEKLPQEAVLRRAEELGFVVSYGYGSIETGGLVISCTWNSEQEARLGTRTIGLAEMDVVDPDTGKSLERDGLTQGKVVFRGNSLMLGYLKDMDKSDRFFKDGWLHIGEDGRMQPGGLLQISDQLKDVTRAKMMIGSGPERRNVFGLMKTRRSYTLGMQGMMPTRSHLNIKMFPKFTSGSSILCIRL